MTTSPPPDELCIICRKPEFMHHEQNFRHKFAQRGQSNALMIRDDAPDDASPARTSSDQGRVRMMPGGDPVLRMVLIRKGLISPDDLTSVEEELRATGVVGHDPESLGQSGGR